MCEFFSWVEKGTGKNKKIYFLTQELIHNTPRGEGIQRRFPGAGNLTGHAAIKAYFELRGGTDRECTDFSTPENFPSLIVAAIKEGKFRGLGTPKELLTQPARARYEKVEQPAMARYEKVEQAAWARYEKVKQAAWARYEKVEQPAFWDLFAIPKNRNPKWR